MEANFSPKKDWKVGGIFIFILIVIGMPVLLIMDMPIWLYLVEFIPVMLIGWLWFGTSYSINDQTVNYRSGPFIGNIPISTIISINKYKFSWNGFPPSLSFNGLKIRYGPYSEIFIAPENESRFLDLIKRYNPDVIIQ